MQKRSHKLLASALLDATNGFRAKRFEWAFLLGSFQPDCNPFTYLRGFCLTHRLHGHHFSATRPYIHSRIAKLNQCTVWKMRQYYLLGKLTHYLADAFTSPHNPTFRIGIVRHHNYEKQLRHHLATQLSLGIFCLGTRTQNPMASIEELHRQYLHSGGGIHWDTHYILRVSCLLIASCYPAALSV